ncbi:MAG: histidine--tRNA ligase [Brevinematia bacterium]
MSERFLKLRGFLDIYGDDLHFFEVIENTFRKYAKIYGFEEIKLPILERTELFVRGIGEGSDIVRKEMFSFRDRGDRDVTMRPEGTAGVVRAFLENNFLNEPKYHKLFYIGAMFRAERPQAGRLRQFHQAGIEWFGSDSPLIDFESITMLWYILRELGISDKVKLVINNVGCRECVPNYKKILISFFDENISEFCEDCKERRNKNILRVFDCKNHSCQNTLKSAPKIKEYLCSNCKHHLDNLSTLLSKEGISFVIDDNLVRGLDYYTRNVFEIKYEGIGTQNAIAGGGRYNNLVSEFGGPEIPAFGFAIGIERTILALKENINIPKKISVAICNASSNEIEPLFKIAKTLRNKGITTHTLFHIGNLNKQMKLANKIGVKFTIIVGEEELKENKVSLKNMETGEQNKMPIEDIINILSNATT